MFKLLAPQAVYCTSSSSNNFRLLQILQWRIVCQGTLQFNCHYLPLTTQQTVDVVVISSMPFKGYKATDRNLEKIKNENSSLVSSLSPREIVSELDRFVVGQNKAKKAVAVALRNRWRRQALKGEMKNELNMLLTRLYLPTPFHLSSSLSIHLHLKYNAMMRMPNLSIKAPVCQ